MAERPVFIPDPAGCLVEERLAQFHWNPGFALVQKRKNIQALHDAAAIQLGKGTLLEVSTKSPRALGARLSAFNLHVSFGEAEKRIPLESAFQGSKVFAESGQHREIYSMMSGTDAKRVARQYETDELVAFSYEGRRWPTRPLTAFYDWLYLRALLELSRDRPSLMDELVEFEGFTDIEFNPKRSLNCQARSCALFVALTAWEDLSDLMQDPDRFLATLGKRGYGLVEERRM